jgi:FKBP-type peptidyl-prolyl isomerase-like protein
MKSKRKTKVKNNKNIYLTIFLIFFISSGVKAGSLSKKDIENLQSSKIWNNSVYFFDWWVDIKGSGEMAYSGKIATIEVDIYLYDGYKNIYDTKKINKPIRFMVGYSQVIYGVDRVVEQMRVGDKRLLLIKPNAAYGRVGVSGQIPPNSWLIVRIELIAVEPGVRSKYIDRYWDSHPR